MLSRWLELRMFCFWGGTGCYHFLNSEHVMHDQRHAAGSSALQAAGEGSFGFDWKTSGKTSNSNGFSSFCWWSFLAIWGYVYFSCKSPNFRRKSKSNTDDFWSREAAQTVMWKQRRQLQVGMAHDGSRHRIHWERVDLYRSIMYLLWCIHRV